MTDHPPAIPAIQVRHGPRILVTPYGVIHYGESPTPLGLSPEQPARVGGGE